MIHHKFRGFDSIKNFYRVFSGVDKKSEIETKLNCRTVWVWHTQTKIPNTSQDELDKEDPEIVKLI